MIKFEKPLINWKNVIIAGLVAYTLAASCQVIACNHTVEQQTERIRFLHDENMQLAHELDQLKHKDTIITPADLPAFSEPQKPLVSLGMFEVTAYCHCAICCGREGQLTASGTYPATGRTIGVDPDILPYGTEVVINGHKYVAEDTGGAMQGRHIDIFMNSHEEALQFGRQQIEVFAYE